MDMLTWTLGVAVVVLLVVIAAMRSRSAGALTSALPSRWALQPRPVLSDEERRIFRHLVESLPEHSVLVKLPLVRFCQPTDPMRVQYWFDLLGPTHVPFAVCTPTGRIVAAIDIDGDRPGSPRSQQIKKAVLAACRIRHLRVKPGALPSSAELRIAVQTVPQHAAAREAPANVAPRQAPRVAPEGSADFADSFFDPASRYDEFLSSEFGALASRRAQVQQGAADDRFIGHPLSRPARTS